ncbi:tumor necrosis factor receptor superfamily member 13B [Labeo rohita]|uniref:Tumor necrosis factor receptor superfamily member 13B n=1 Tax=Labeo rohita TaxID=84645 RepID=A0A498MYV2_LABRO|nr:tumor necrosis factor receptor superfamily member 13B [Labeo rohita]
MMAQSCPEGQYLDSLLRKCMSCSLVCHDIKIQNRCSEYCVAWKCKAVSGQFYDTLLKKCLRCSELCGSHPAPCADACRNSLMARADEVSQEGSVTQDRPRATETCIYCFSEHTVAPRTLYQQAGAQEPVRAAAAAENLHHDNGAPHQPLQTHADKSRAFRIICSPTQTSM